MITKPPANRAPDWTIWRHARRLKLWEAVALSLNIDPDKVRFSPNGWMAGGSLVFNEPQPFDQRLRIALSNVSTRGPLVPLGLYQGVLSSKAAEIELGAFGAWASSIGWDIPPDLPTTAAASSTPDQPDERDRNQELYEYHEALKKQGDNKPSAKTAKKFGIGDRRVRQIVDKMRPAEAEKQKAPKKSAASLSSWPSPKGGRAGKKP